MLRENRKIILSEKPSFLVLPNNAPFLLEMNVTNSAHTLCRCILIRFMSRGLASDYA